MHTYYDNFIAHYYAKDSEVYIELKKAGDVLFATAEKALLDSIDLFYATNCNIGETKAERQRIAEQTGVHFYMVNYIFLVCASQRVKAEYEARGWSMALFYDTFEDLDYKLKECKDIHGVYGNFVEVWYPIFYRLQVFKLGRLEFEICGYPKDEPYVCGNVTLRRGDPVISVHIPATGTPLSPAARLDSYKKAYAFAPFASAIYDGKLAMFCDSWLLFEGNRNIFPADLNIAHFLDDFDIIASVEEPTYRDAWRLFGVFYHGNPDELPQDNRARRAMATWLKSGKYSGVGFGVKLFSPNDIT